MKKLKKSEKVINLLLEKGCKEIKSKSKYKQFTRPGRNDFYFVGRAGALRTGKTASKSTSLTRFLKI